MWPVRACCGIEGGPGLRCATWSRVLMEMNTRQQQRANCAPVIQDNVRGGHQLCGAQREEARVAGSGADQVDLPRRRGGAWGRKGCGSMACCLQSALTR